MKKFKYLAFNEQEIKIKGYIEEEDIDIAKNILQGKQLRIIRIEKIQRLSDVIPKRQFNSSKLADFCGEMGVILESGVTIVRGIEILMTQSDDMKYKGILERIHGSVQKGFNLSTAMERTEVFPSLLIEMIASGELTSHLTEILLNMEEYYKREAVISGKIKSASVYPIMMLSVAVLMIIFFNVYVFDEMKSLFEDTSNLPLITKGLLATMDGMKEHTVAIIVVFLIAIFLIRSLRRVKVVKYYYDKFMLRLPIFGVVKMNILTSRMTTTMAIFMKSAIPIVKVMSMLEVIVNNEYIGLKVANAKEDVRRGISISEALESQKEFDTMFVQMVNIGEETGKLEEMLFRVSDIYEKRTEIGIERLVSLIEPVFTLIIGALIGLVIIALALPIFNMSDMLSL